MNYYIYGTSYKLIDTEIEKILKGKKYSSSSLQEVSLDSVLEDLGYDSLFQEEKVIVLRDFDTITSSKKDTEEDLKRLLNYLENPVPSTTMILIGKDKLPSRGVTKELAKRLNVIETPSIFKPYELAKLLEGQFRKEGYSITKPVLDEFSTRCNCNYDIAINEYEKLKKNLGPRKNVTLDDIEKFVSNYNLNDSLGFKDAVINKNISKALKMLDDLESSKMEVIQILVTLAKEYQAVYDVKLLAKTLRSNDEIGREMNNMHPFRVKLLREAGTKYTEEKLEELILYLCNLDLKMTSEDNLGYDELRKFLLKLQ